MMPAPSTVSTSSGRGWTGRLLAFLSDQETILATVFLLFAIAFSFYQLYPETALKVPPLNDNNLHLMAFERAVQALRAVQDPLDHWLGTITTGYPLFHYYQNIPHVVLALLYLPFQHSITSQSFFDWARTLLLSLFPLSIYLAMRWIGFRPLPAALAALAAPMLATYSLYGLDFSSYVWRGYGMYTQLWGMLLLPLALAAGWRALRDGRGYTLAALLLALTLLSHLVYGYMAVLSLLVAAVIGGDDWQGRTLAGRSGRLLAIFALAGLLAAYFIIPYWQDRVYMNRSVWEYAGKYDSYGYEWVLPALARGELFDAGRLPVLTLLVGIGLAAALWRWRRPEYRLVLALFVFWLLLYFGRPTWGVLLDLLPFSQEMHFHRLIGGLHLAGIFLAGVALALPWQAALERPGKPQWLVAALLLTGLFLTPAVRERAAYLAGNTQMLVDHRSALLQEDQDLGALMETLRSRPPGRVYAGLPADWGSQYRVGDIPVYSLLNWAGFDMLGYLYHALSLNADVQVLFDENRLELYNLFNVRYVVAPVERSLPDFLQPVGVFGRHRLYQVETSGYFDLVDSAQVLSGSKQELYPAASVWLTSAWPALRQHPRILLNGAGAAQNAVYPLAQMPALLGEYAPAVPPPAGRILDESVSSNGYRATVEAAADGMVMLKATYHPNMRFWVDGSPAEAVMVMPSFSGVRIPAGVHQVEAIYQPPAWKWWLMAAGLLVLALVAWGERRRPATPAAQARLGRWWDAFASRVRRLAWLNRLTPHLPYLALLAGLVLLAARPALQPQIMHGHDALEYLPRSQLFYQELASGDFFPRWTAYLNAGYGEPFFNFNPPVFYYLTSLWHALGSSFVLAQNLAALTVTALAGLGMYLLVATAAGRPAGLAAAAAYLFAPYFMVNLYVRQALADFTAFAWLPYAFWGVERFSRKGQAVFLALGSAAAALLLLSSNPVALITFPFLVLWAAWLAYQDRSWRSLGRGLVCLGLGAGLAAYFWAPALAESSLVHLERLKQGYLNYRNHFVQPQQLLVSAWGYGYSLSGPEDGASFQLGIPQLLAWAAALAFLPRIRRRSPLAGQWAVLGLATTAVAAFLASQPAAFLWDRLPLLQIIEFPWRYLSLAVFGLALLVGTSFTLLPAGQKRLEKLLLVGWLSALLLVGLPMARPQSFWAVTDADYTPQRIAAGDIAVTTAREYEPVWVQQHAPAAASQTFSLLSGEGSLLSIRPRSTYLEAQVGIQTPAHLRANTLYFPGWRLYVNGLPHPFTYDNPQGVIEFRLDPGEYQVQLVFEDTLVRRWGEMISLAALAILGWVVVRSWRKIKPGRSPDGSAARQFGNEQA